MDVGVADNVVLGVPCSVGIAQDAEGDIRAVVEGIRADAGNIAEVADGFQRSAVTECTRADFVTLFRLVMLTSDLQLAKAPIPIVCAFDILPIVLSEPQDKNAWSPMLVTLLRLPTLASALQLANAFSPICVSFGILPTLISEVQPWKALFPRLVK